VLNSPVLSSPIPKCRFTYLSLTPALTPAGTILGGTWRIRALSQAVENSYSTRFGRRRHMRQRPGIFAKRRSQVRVLPSTLCVQQPCKNPDEYPENLVEPPRRVCANLQRDCKTQKPPAIRRTSLIRKRTPVRVQRGPLFGSRSYFESPRAKPYRLTGAHSRSQPTCSLWRLPTARKKGGAKEEGSVRWRLKPLPAPPSGSLIGRTLPPDLARALPVRADNARTPGRGVPRLSRGFRARTL
jgi:hypothetical protein